MKGIFVGLLAGIGIIALALIILFLSVAVGYWIGMLLAIIPFVGDWLTSTLPVTRQQIPSITAWLAVAGLFLGGSKVRAANTE